jgi:ferredoxin
MSYVITRLCRDCIDSACTAVCPVAECILEHRPPPGTAALPNQLFISPSQCIDCAACEPECPWEAIFPEEDVPAAFSADVALNAISATRPEEFVEAIFRQSLKPRSDEVEANRRRWETGAT